MPRHRKSEFRAQGEEEAAEGGGSRRKEPNSRASEALATAVRQQCTSSRAPASDRACRASPVPSPASSREPSAASQPASPAFWHSPRLPRRRRAERQDTHERARFRRTRATSMQQEAPSGESRRASAKREQVTSRERQTLQDLDAAPAGRTGAAGPPAPSAGTGPRRSPSTEGSACSAAGWSCCPCAR